GWAVIERAAALQPDSFQIQCFRARLRVQLGRRDEALAQARQLAALGGSAENTAYPKAEAIGLLMAYGLRDEAEKIFPGMPPEISASSTARRRALRSSPAPFSVSRARTSLSPACFFCRRDIRAASGKTARGNRSRGSGTRAPCA